MLFGKKGKLKDVVSSAVSNEHYNLLDKWKAIYAGNLKEWHEIKYQTLDGVKKRRMHTLNMAKVACEELAKLIFNEQVSININDKQFSNEIENILEDNRFYKDFQNKIEQMLALGGLVLKPFVEINELEKRIRISYVTPDCFIPTSYNNDDIHAGVFLDITIKGDKVYYLVEIHDWTIKNVKVEGKEESVKKKVYTIENKLYLRNKDAPDDVKQIQLSELYPDLENYVEVEDLTYPLFVYIKPNIANNFDLQSPLGISLFANALDTLYALDVAFDSFIREFRLGRRRIIVPSSAVRAVIDPDTGMQHRYFDATDEVYQAFNLDEAQSKSIIDNTVSLRVEEHTSAINSLLNLYAMQLGLTTGIFTFDGTSVKTATEVISEQSKTFKTKQVNENLIEEGLVKLIKVIGQLGTLYNMFSVPENVKIEMDWDDSIISDRDSDADFYIKFQEKGLLPRKYVLMHALNLTEEQADDLLRQVDEEKMTTNPDISELLALRNIFGDMEVNMQQQVQDNNDDSGNQSQRYLGE